MINLSLQPDFDHTHQLLSHMIGHEGEGSILSLLKSKGWASALSASSSTFRSWALFEVEVGRSHISAAILLLISFLQIRLTAAGLAAVNDVVRIVYQYINMLRDPQQTTLADWQRIFREVSQVHAH